MKKEINKQELNKTEWNKLITHIPHETDLYPEEKELIFAYRVMNDMGKRAMIKVAQDFARTPTMRCKWVRGV